MSRPVRSRSLRSFAAVAAFGLGLAMVSGCGRSDLPLAAVSGKVTLNGQPLSGALVEFQPDKGAPSYGETDKEGRYALRYSRRFHGAMLGSHKVRIRTERPSTDAKGNETLGREIIPAQYNAKTLLTARVEPKNPEINFDLSSDRRLATQSR